MNPSIQEQLTAKIVALILGGVTVLVVPQSVTDPVNVTKLFLLGGLAFAAFGASISKNSISTLRKDGTILLLLGLFLTAAVISFMVSAAPKSQSFYGVYGRNNGFLLYLLLVMSFIATLTIKNRLLTIYLIKALFLAGSINVAYGLWVVAFGDFIGWNNIYGNLLGTLGNPNFIGSFFGLFSGLLFSYFFAPTTSNKIRIGIVSFLALVFFGIMQTHAVQGKVLFVSALVITLFLFVRSKFNNPAADFSYIVITSIGFLLVLLGTLQKGPLSGILYKQSVSLRGQYWYAGWQTGSSHPLFGVGFDSYGDWYRRSRRESALTLPGVDTVSNTAHNVYLDIFSFGGWPLFLAYIGISIYVIFAILRHLKNTRHFDPVFSTLITVWTCYQLQSIISINQIGLAIWGWIFGAAIISYVRAESAISSSSSSSIKPSNKKRKNDVDAVFSPQLIGGLSLIVGLLVSVPPLSADVKWRDAQISQNVEKVESTLKSSYMNPPNTFKYSQVVGAFETNGFNELAHKYALESVKFNPESFELWRNLSILKLTTQQEKVEAFKNMKRLDPLNPNLGVKSN